ILIGLITSIAALVWAFNRLQQSGVDLNSFNPFHWFRRHKWAKLYSIKPLHRLESAIEGATVLVLGVAKLQGEITKEIKGTIIQTFVHTFCLSEKQALEAFTTASFLWKDSANYIAEVKHIVDPLQSHFSRAQKKSIIETLNYIANVDGQLTDEQSLFIKSVEKAFGKDI
ncbi:TerB family tellurite resistance protein, partial [Zooshikella harenae]